MKTSRILAMAAIAGLVPAAVPAASVSTAFGTGADLEIREHSNNVSDGTSMNTRTSSGGDRNEIIALAFDLSGYTLSNLESVGLNLYSFRLDNSTRFVNLYGVTQGSSGGSGSFTTETWSESLGVFGDVPGLDNTDSDFTTQSINAGAVTALGEFTIASGQAEGSVQTLMSDALDTFIQNYAGSSRVTFLLAAGNSSTGQFRVGSREATGTATGVITGAEGVVAPFLSFTVVPEPSAFALTGLGVLALVLRRRR